MAITLTFNQPGLPEGATDRGRTDILADGSTVTITVGSIPDGSLVELTILDEPPGSAPSLLEESPSTWQLSFAAGVWGPFRIRATATIGTDVVSAVTRRISIRSPELGLHYPALAERTDPNATLVPTPPSVQLTEMNEGETNRPLVNFHRDLLEAVEDLAAGGGGGGGGTASALATSGDPVNVADADPPVAGQVLMAVGDGTSAEWVVPGLHYDQAIRYWINTAGEATIEPGSWGFVYQTPEGSEGVTVYVVSSLESPPVDSRIGLYVSPLVAVPVTVSLVGASQIMGLDGVLATSITLRPGAMYEWVFYHETAVAIWGLVSDTAHVAKAIATSGAAVNVASSGPPSPGDVLTATDSENAAWSAPSSSNLIYGGTGSPTIGHWTRPMGGTTYLPTPSAVDQRTAVYSPDIAIQVQVGDGVAAQWREEMIAGSGGSITIQPRIWAEWTSSYDDDADVWVWLPNASDPTVYGPVRISDTEPSTSFPGPGFMVVATGPVTVPLPDRSNLRLGILALSADITVNVASGVTLVWNLSSYDDATPLTLPAGTYAEWISYSDGPAMWLPVTNPAAVGGSAGLTYGGESNDCIVGQWVNTFTNGGAVTIPTAAADGDTIGLSVQLTGQNKSITVPSDTEVRLEGRWYTEGEVIPLRAGAYYEWSALGAGEVPVRWYPRGTHHTLTPPLERADPALDTPMPNQVVYGSDTDPVTLPGPNQNLKDGDSFAVLVDAGCDVTVPSGVRLYAIDMSEYVDGPGTLTLFASTYHEWIYHADSAYWLPRESGAVSQAALESALDRDAGASLNMGGKILSNVGTPAAGTDAATRAYVDAAATPDPMAIKATVRTVATAAITLSGTQTVNSVALVAGNRCLVTANTAANNGIYVVAAGAWTLATDFNTSAKVKSGLLVAVTEGIYSDTLWTLTTNDPIALGTTGLAFAQIAATGAPQIQTKVLASTTSAATDSDLTQLSFDIAGGETVVLEWDLLCRNADVGTGTTDNWKLQTSIPSGSIPMTRFALHAQWTIGNAIVATNQTAGPLNASVHHVLGNTFPAGQVTTRMAIRIALTNGGGAFNIRPYLQRSTTGAPVFAGSWGRITRNPTVS